MTLEYSITTHGGILGIDGLKDDMNRLREYYPQPLVHYPDIVQILYQVQMWSSLSDEAKIMLDYCLYNTPRSKSGMKLSQVIRSIFNRKWGYTKTDRVFRQ